MLHKLSEYVGISGMLSRVTPHMRLQLKGFALAFAGVAMQSCNYITAKIAMADPKRIEEGGLIPRRSPPFGISRRPSTGWRWPA